MIEILTFVLRAGVDDERFVAVDARVQTEFAYQQPGIARRTTGRNDDGRWLVLHVWVNEEAATDAHTAFDASELGGEFTSLIDPDSIRCECFAGLEPSATAARVPARCAPGPRSRRSSASAIAGTLRRSCSRRGIAVMSQPPEWRPFAHRPRERQGIQFELRSSGASASQASRPG
jgi:hypothetical protein